MRHRLTTEAGIEFLKGWERLRLKPYDDGYGYMTVGFGHLVRSGESFSEITEDEAENLLRKDLFSAERSVLRLVTVPLADCQYDALVSFVFNAGGGALQTSTLRMKLNREEPVEDVAQEFMKWVWSAGKKSNGLVRRRKAEKEMFLG